MLQSLVIAIIAIIFISILLKLFTKRSNPITSKEKVKKDEISDIEDLYHDCNCTISEQEEREFGFKRDEFKQKIPPGESVKFHKKLVVWCSGKKSTEWDAQETEKDEFSASLSKALKKLEIKVCAIEDAPKYEGKHDILIFPDMIRVSGLTQNEIPALTKAFSDEDFSNFETEKLDGDYVFVCCHHKRDRRCGVCGPRIFKAFCEKAKESSRKLHVKRISHVGGHMYAANVIVFRYDQVKKCYYGDWFGYVSIFDVKRIIKENIEEGKIIPEIWRGRTGISTKVAQALIKFYS